MLNIRFIAVARRGLSPLLEKWENSVRNRQGFEGKKGEQEHMLLSAEIRTGNG